MEIDFEDFEKICLNVGKIVQVDDFPEAKKPAYKLLIDFGELGVKTSSARITDRYEKADLLGKLVICATNLSPRKIGPFVSEVLTTGFYKEDGTVVLAVPDQDAPLGARLA
jgi:tRNA-binding protein